MGHSLTFGLWAYRVLFPGNLLTSFFVLLAFASLPHLEAGLFALEGGLIAAAIHVLAKRGLAA